MIKEREAPVFSILDESPFFSQLSIKEMEMLIEDLFEKYPHLMTCAGSEPEVGYEASWLSQGSNL